MADRLLFHRRVNCDYQDARVPLEGVGDVALEGTGTSVFPDQHVVQKDARSVVNPTEVEDRPFQEPAVRDFYEPPVPALLKPMALNA